MEQQQLSEELANRLIYCNMNFMYLYNGSFQMEILTGEYLSTCTVIQTIPLFVYGQITDDPLPHTSQHPNVLQKQHKSYFVPLSTFTDFVLA